METTIIWPAVLFISLLFMLITFLLYRQRRLERLASERSIFEAQLRAHRDQYQTLVNNIPGITYRCLFDEHWTMQFISAHVTDFTGYNANELIDNKHASFAQLIVPEDNDRAAAIVSQAIEKGEPWETEYRVQHKDGRIRWAFERGRAVFDEQGQVQYLDGFILDITEEKSTKESLERFAALVRNSNDAMFVVRQGIIIDCNNATLQMFKKNYDEIVGFDPGRISPPHQANGESSEALAQRYLHAAASGQPQRFEWLHQRGDGTLFDAEVALSSFVQSSEILAIGIVRDITGIKQREREILELNESLEQRVNERTTELRATLESLKRTQDELLRNAKLASLGSLVAGVAHELNTPIGNAVTVSSSLLDEHRAFVKQLEQGVTRATLDSFLQDVEEGSRIIERNLTRAAELIGGFKQLAVDQTSYQRRTFMAHEVVHKVAMTINPNVRQAGIQLHQSIPESITLDSYPGPLGQVLLNLINNTIVHAFTQTTDKQVWINAELSSEEWLKLTVLDNGCGIGEEHLKKVFDPFYTTRLGQGGSGLGLHITYSLVTGILGGRIEVTNSDEGGAQFTLFLPLVAPTPEESED